MKKIIVLLAISLIMVMNVLAQEPTPTPHDLIPGLFLYQDDFVPGLLTKMWEYYYLLPFPTNTPVPTNTPTPTNTPDYDLTYLKLDTSNDPLINPLRILGSAKQTVSGNSPLGNNARLFIDGLGYIDFGGSNINIGDRRGITFTYKTTPTPLASIIYNGGAPINSGLFIDVTRGKYEVNWGERLCISGDNVETLTIEVKGTPTTGVGSIGMEVIGDDRELVMFGANYGFSEGVLNPPANTEHIWRGFAADMNNIYAVNMPSGVGYDKLVALDILGHKLGYVDWPTPVTIPSTPTPTATPTPWFTGTPVHGDMLMYVDTIKKFRVRDWQNQNMWNANQLQFSRVKFATPTPGVYLGFIEEEGTPMWAPVTPIPTLAPPTPQPIPDTPTPYHVPVEMTPEPPISHANLEAILGGDPDEIPDGSHYFITDGDTYLYSVAVADARFFVSGYTPVFLPTPTPTPEPDYIVSKAGTTLVNGNYYADGTSDGVACYSLDGAGVNWLYRYDERGVKYWAINGDKSAGDPMLKLYFKEHKDDTPYLLGPYDIGTGSRPGATVSE